MTEANKKFQQLSRRVHAIKAGKLQNNEKGEIKVTTAEVICQHCGFKTRYQFIRCPHCGEEKK